MGNRAVITTAPYKASDVGIYIHWNGGRASVEAFLEVAKTLEYRAPGEDRSYAIARLTQVIANYFVGGLSIGIDTCDRLDTDNGNNGTYLIGKDWEIVGRKFFDGEEEVDPAKTKEIVAEILAKMGRLEKEKSE